MDGVGNYLVTLPSFLLYFACSLALTAAFLFIYMRVTPHNEWKLIGDGNAAAALSLAGAGLGFILPLASSIAHSLSVIDMIVWGVVAMAVQLATFLVARLLRPGLVAEIDQGRMASAIALAALSVGIGILNAACMSY